MTLPKHLLLAGLCLLGIASQGRATTLFGVVTDRAAPAAVEAARLHLASHPQDRILLRTPAQLLAATPKQLQQWLSADAVLSVSTFGDPARRLAEALPIAKASRVLAMNGEQRLNLMTRIGKATLADFPGDTLQQLTGEAPSTTALAAAANHPIANDWLASRRTWQAGGSAHIAQLYDHLLHGSPLREPTPEPSLRLRVDTREVSGASVAELISSFSRKRESSTGAKNWIPASAGMTEGLVAGPVLAVLDLSNIESGTARALCAESRRQGLPCAEVLARWGGASREALEHLPQLLAPARPAALVVVQDFVVGAAENREAVTEALTKLDIPVIKAIRLTERSTEQWRLSPEGLPVDSVQYRVALPELQGSGQPIVVAAVGQTVADALTGIEIRQTEPIATEVRRLIGRAVRWQQLAAKANRDKRLAIVYYNHPPGRQNIGADNLDVPATLFEVLQRLKAEGYSTGELPPTQEALLDLIMARGVNLPEDNEALHHLASEVDGVPQRDYAKWFTTLPPRVQGEMIEGPLGRLHAEVLEAERSGERRIGRKRVEAVMKELHHLAEGAAHAKRLEAIAGLKSLEAGYLACLVDEGTAAIKPAKETLSASFPRQRTTAQNVFPEPASAQEALRHPRGSGGPAPFFAPKPLDSRLRGNDTTRPACNSLTPLKGRIAAYGVEGLRGWGPTPGRVMVAGERLLVPGLHFGNIFIGPQPPRGWEVDEELLHANTSVPPPHQYLAFYHWIRDVFKADAVVHVGRHSTYEFLPGKAVGLSADDYPSLIASDLPGIYPYIVDGVGEGIQAKRRGLAVMVDHLTPPLTATPLYDKLLELRQVVESYEATNSESLKAQAARTMREQVLALNLRAELEASMADVLEVRGIGFEDADDDLLAHEVGHYLTKLQEKFMPHGLHVFGRDWSEASLKLMADSMAQVAGGYDAAVAQKLKDSPRLEMAGLLAGLNGQFVPPGKGNDPLRAPEALPTGRNFHAVDGDILPTKIGFKLGHDLAEKALARTSVIPAKAEIQDSAPNAMDSRFRGNDRTLESRAATMQSSAASKHGHIPRSAGEDRKGCSSKGDDCIAAAGSDAVILWASDAVRDEGAMVAFCLSLLGAEPVWNARGIVTDVRLTPGAVRRDVIVTASGLFRDLYPNLINQIDRAGRLALAASAGSLSEQRPELKPALEAALAPLVGTAWGREPLAGNRVAQAWLQRTGQLQTQGLSTAEAGRGAALRIFGDAPGAYSAGVNRLAERSGAWKEREELGRVYLNRLGHAYGLDASGEAEHAAFNLALAGVSRSYHGRASNLYGLLDNNDAFDYLGGLSLGVETLTGRRPEGLILQHADPAHAAVEPLTTALLSELRGRYLNPEWIKPLMNHGYAGARTMGQEFLENLWGWQVTRPDLIQPWTWDEVKQTYFDDKQKLGLPQFLGQGHNAHVKAQMLAIFMVAAERKYWQADDATLKQMGSELVHLVNKNGLPGSGHTAPNHPIWQWLASKLDPADASTLGVVLAKASGEGAYRPAAAAPLAHSANPGRPVAASASRASQPAPPTPVQPPLTQRYALKEITSTPRPPLPSPWLLLGGLALFAGGLWQGTRSERRRRLE